MTRIKTRQVFIYIFKMVHPFKLGLAVMLLDCITMGISKSIQPYTLKVIIDRVEKIIPGSDVLISLFWPVLAYIAVFLVVQVIIRTYIYVVDIRMLPEMQSRISRHAFDSLTEQGNKFYQNNFAGSIANKISELTNSVPELITTILADFLGNFFVISFAIFTLWQVNIQFALAILIWCIFFIGLSYFSSQKAAKLSANYSETNSKLGGKYVDIFTNILSLRLFARKPYEVQNIEENFTEVKLAARKVWMVYFWIFLASDLSFAIVQILSLYILLMGLKDGWVTAGDFVLVITINTSIGGYLRDLTSAFSKFSKHLGRITQALNSIVHPLEIQDKDDARSLCLKNTDIVFDRVRFQYNNTTPLFDDLSVVIDRGTKVGLVGYSGSGKTTFVNLILRLYDINKGNILIDGQNIIALTQDSLRANLAMIPQDPGLFHRSLMENIRYGRINATDEEVYEAAKKAHAHEFISALPDSYNSLVGERGVKLSGGQRQRIAIARAILKDAPILILDEATSQLDSVTESYIQESLIQLMEVDKNRTTIVIAHRLSTLLHMDRILVFNNGKIVEDGTHKELLKKGEMYKQLWNAQVGGFFPKYST